MGRFYDRFGGRRLVLASLTLVSICTALLALTNHIVFLIIDFGVIISIVGAGGSLTIISAILTKWFYRRRGAVLGIAASAMSIGGLIFVPFAAYLIDLVGWRSTWVILGALMAVVALPTAFFILRENPREFGLLPDGDSEPPQGQTHESGLARAFEIDHWFDSFKSSPMWFLCAGYFVCGFTTNMLQTHFVPLAVDRGFSHATAATAFGVMSGFNVVGVLVASVLGDRFGRKNLLAFIYFLRGISFAILLFDHGWFGLWSFTALSGFSWIATAPLTTAMTADMYGLKNIGVLGGVVFGTHQVGGAIGVQMAGILRDVTGDYSWSLAVGAIALIAAGVVSIAIQERRYSIRYQVARGAAAASSGGGS
jgi:MFS family permease